MIMDYDVQQNVRISRRKILIDYFLPLSKAFAIEGREQDGLNQLNQLLIYTLFKNLSEELKMHHY